jgi:AraC-like DNA-binding protein
VHETTLFQYFQQLQMQKAKEMILQENQLISEIARKFSYVNASKFATAFRKHHECLPSEVCQKTKPENELIR